MNRHLTDDEFIGNIHLTLIDAQRESMDRHLADCPRCRGNLSDHIIMQRHIRHSLLADLRAIRPSLGMGFAAISPNLKRRRSTARLWQPFFFATTSLAALIGLVIALTGSLENFARFVEGSTQMPTSPLPIVASFLFALPVIGNYYESRIVRPQLILSAILACILWIGTAIVGLQNIIDIRGIFISIYILLGGDFQVAVSLGLFVTLISALMWIALIIGGGEYHYKRVGQRSSWKLFGWTIAGELSILILSHFI